MKLFEDHPDSTKNLLPQDGTVQYFGKIFSDSETGAYLNSLLNEIPWQPDEAVIFGRHITTKREIAWYGDESFRYTYSKTTRHALPWNQTLQQLKRVVEKQTAETFNSCLLNLYHNGQEGMGWHSDAEKDLQKHAAIASLSFGAERKFAFKHTQTGKKVSFILENGSLLLMKGTTQEYWLHSLPKSKKITSPRVNLTFRTIKKPGT